MSVGQSRRETPPAVAPTTPRGTPHRPSRRRLIVDAAIKVFARKGFSQSSIQRIADEAGMVPTAVYYHFSGKEELFESALRRAMDESDAAAVTETTVASWSWVEEHPDKARMLYLHLPGGATSGTRALRDDYENRHVSRSFDRLPANRIPASRRSAATQQAGRMLAVRTTIGMITAVHALRVEGGPLASVSRDKLQQASAEIATRILATRIIETG